MGESRIENILEATINGEEYTEPSGSRIETLLIELNELIIEGGGGGSSDYAVDLSMTINSSTFVITAQLINKDGDPIGTPQTIDLPMESVVVGASYDSTNKAIVLTLQNGNTTSIPIGDIIYGLQPLIDAQHKLDADLVDDTDSNNKFVTSAEKTTISKAVTTDDIGLGTDYVVYNGVRIYISPTEPTGNIPDGSIWIPGGISS